MFQPSSNTTITPAKRQRDGDDEERVQPPPLRPKPIQYKFARFTIGKSTTTMAGNTPSAPFYFARVEQDIPYDENELFYTPAQAMLYCGAHELAEATALQDMKHQWFNVAARDDLFTLLQQTGLESCVTHFDVTGSTAGFRLELWTKTLLLRVPRFHEFSEISVELLTLKWTTLMRHYDTQRDIARARVIPREAEDDTETESDGSSVAADE